MLLSPLAQTLMMHSAGGQSRVSRRGFSPDPQTRPLTFSARLLHASLTQLELATFARELRSAELLRKVALHLLLRRRHVAQRIVGGGSLEAEACDE